MSRHVFREYDIRGNAERDLDSEFVRRIGRALAEQLAPASGAAPRLAVGRDCRLSSPRLFSALTQGLQQGGAAVLDIGVGPSPKLYFAVHHLQTDGGVMITGSHNDAPDNGLKTMIGRASFYGGMIQALRERVEAPEPPPRAGGSVTPVAVDDDYVAALTNGIRIGRPLKVVADAGNGAAGPLGVRALRAVGVEPTALFCEMDGNFPNHHPDPTVPKNLQALIDTVRAEGADVGVAWDGDGDRLGVVDASGDIVWGDRLLSLFAGPIIEKTPGACVIGDVKCSQTLFDHVSKLGGRPIMWKTGHSLIKTKMKEEHAAIAGEMSGHFFFADRYFGYDDGVYAALRLLELLSSQEKPLGELLRVLPQRSYTPELRVDCPDDAKFAVIEKLRASLRGQGSVNELDGVRVTYPDGSWALARASNTGPVLVLRVEAPNETRLAEVRSELEAHVSEARRSVVGA